MYVFLQDKIYLGIANGSVDVRDARNLQFLRSINHTPSQNEQNEFGAISINHHESIVSVDQNLR